MFGVKKVAHHAGLMEQMADTVGADLREAVADHRLSAADYRTAVIRCTTCEGAEEAPAYCRNRDLLERLSNAKA